MRHDAKQLQRDIEKIQEMERIAFKRMITTEDLVRNDEGEDGLGRRQGGIRCGR